MGSENNIYFPLTMNLPEGWSSKKLKLICSKIGTGATPRGGQKVYLTKRINYALIRSQNVFDHYFDNNGLALIDDIAAKKLRNAEVCPGDILLNITGDGITFARSCIVPNSALPACVNQHVAIIRVNNKLCIPGYLSAVLNHPMMKEYIESFNAGGSRRAITKGHIESFEVPLPKLSTQKAIAHILGSLDDKIELNRRMNETLEGMAQALFKSWFVDFDPVMDNALVAGNPIPDELTDRAEVRRQALAAGTANRDVAKSFPAGFQFAEEMGWVPGGWEAQPLYDIANFINGASFKGADFNNEPNALPIIKIAEIKNGVSGQTKFTQSIKDDKYRIGDGEILLSWSGNPDTSIGTYVWTGGEGWLNQHIFKVLLKDIKERYFVYYQLKLLRPVLAEIARDKQTTGLGHFTGGDMKRLMVFKPSAEHLNTFNKIAAPLYQRHYHNRIIEKELTKLRDTLLPKLISGELRIPEAEKLTEEALA